MRANRLPASGHGQVVFIDIANVRAGTNPQRLGLRTCLFAWGCLAVASWGAVLALGAQLL